MFKDATFSKCRKYRYTLTRIWDESIDPLIVIGLNPSTADETEDDPTIRRCIGFAKQWEFGGVIMLNLFAFRATDPKQMKQADMPIGPINDSMLRIHCNGRVVLCAWGAHGTFQDRYRIVETLKPDRLFVLGLTKAGQPKHPLYIRADTEPTVWNLDRGEGT